MVLRFDIQVSYFTLYLAQFIVEISGFSKVCIWFDHSLRISLVEELTVVQLLVVNGLDLSFVKPFDSFAVFPKSKLYLAVFRN
jgi:hypothetical protein